MEIGVFGGTFDPVHYGHIALARQALDECKLDKIIVIPANEQPFKLDRVLTPGEHRIKILELAFAQYDDILISDVELAKGAVSYTIETLREIKRRNKGAKISFIVGIDSFLKVELWRDAEELLKDYSFITGTRPGYKESELDEMMLHLNKSYGTKIRKIRNEQIPISSTEIQEFFKSDEAFAKVFPQEVERYIFANGLYT